MRTPRARAGAVLVAVLLLAGCGSGALSGPDALDAAASAAATAAGPTGSVPGGSPGTGGSSAGGAQKYRWTLPTGDDSVGTTGEIHGLTELTQRCSTAAAWVQEHWREFESPRNVLVYLAAGYACHDDLGDARAVQDRLLARYGTTGLDFWPSVCAAYRSVASVLAQAPRESFPCPGGEPPRWPTDPTGPDPVDNPITAVDESTATSSPATSSAAASSSPPDAPADGSTLPGSSGPAPEGSPASASDDGGTAGATATGGS